MDTAVEASCEKCDATYHERDQLVVALSKVFPAWIGIHEGVDWEDDWRTIIYIQLPTGQVSWHIHDSERGLFNHLELDLTRRWDGHSTELKYKRLKRLTPELIWCEGI